MAIDTKSISQLITEFRALNVKDSITPETLGALLQRITDLLATAGTSETVEKIQVVMQGLRNAGKSLCNIEQGQTDRNHIYANIQSVNLADGSISTNSGIFIQQATTERAGAMRAQQVTDLNDTRRGLKEVRDILDEELLILYKLLEKLGLDEECTGEIHLGGQIGCAVIDNQLRIYGAGKLTLDGYVPYIFRHVRKRNPFKHRDYPDNTRKYCPKTKGWALYGSRHAVKIEGDIVKFAVCPHCYLDIPQTKFSATPETFLSLHVNKWGEPTVAWGRSVISLRDRNKTIDDHRLIKLRFGIGFGKPQDPGSWRITPAELVTPLAEFSIIYDTSTQSWYFSR